MAEDWYNEMIPGKWYICFGKVLQDVRYDTLMEHVTSPDLPGLERKIKRDGVYFRKPWSM